MIGIYKIENPEGGIYIGQSRNLEKRIKYYISGNCKGQRKVYASLQKHGWDNHTFEILCECEIEKLNELESYYIGFYKSFDTEKGMNLDNGGLTKQQSKETQELRSKSLKGRVMSQEWRDKIGEKSKGRMVGFKHTEESKAKMRAWIRPKRTTPPANKGKGYSKEEKLERHRIANREWRKRVKEKNLLELNTTKKKQNN